MANECPNACVDYSQHFHDPADCRINGGRSGCTADQRQVRKRCDQRELCQMGVTGTEQSQNLREKAAEQGARCTTSRIQDILAKLDDQDREIILSLIRDRSAVQSESESSGR
ncbi:MAG: hypothetical protein DWQ34_06715 [Planctomycetota bacterium]|nr:MAG: hypothetical protein DWQ29_23755 [Planctomycetota bacterium]REJ95214.1 MAG: hypothetical protein DWQ34_06715 [Planctomycetota bacterium]REK25059.1 MAG: hypothetical protein DWQ41_12865 [Planctomycetota bacterium]